MFDAPGLVDALTHRRSDLSLVTMVGLARPAGTDHGAGPPALPAGAPVRGGAVVCSRWWYRRSCWWSESARSSPTATTPPIGTFTGAAVQPAPQQPPAVHPGAGVRDPGAAVQLPVDRRRAARRPASGPWSRRPATSARRGSTILWRVRPADPAHLGPDRGRSSPSPWSSASSPSPASCSTRPSPCGCCSSRTTTGSSRSALALMSLLLTWVVLLLFTLIAGRDPSTRKAQQ